MPTEIRRPPEFPQSRNLALDGLRTLAMIRVISWHASGWAWLTWVVSSVPAMFFVTGSLLARSFTNRSYLSVIWRRAQRLFPTLWAFTGVVFLISLTLEIRTSPLWTFVFPINQPHSDIAGGWFTSPMWYLRAYIWVLLLSPLLYFAVRHLGAIVPVVGAIAIVGLHYGVEQNAGTLWVVGDIVLYSTFATVGMLWTLRLSFPTKYLVVVTSLSAILTLIVISTSQFVDTVVNNSHLLHLTVGGFWSGLLLLFPQLLISLANSRIGTYLNQYPLSVYLWHSVAAWTMWQLLRPLSSEPTKALLATVFTFASIPVITATVGWIESRTFSTPIKTLTSRLVLALGILWVAFMSPVSARLDFYSANVDIPLPPSDAPQVIQVEISDDVASYLSRVKASNISQQLRNEEFQKVLNKHNQDMNLGGLRAIVITKNGEQWSGRTSDMKPFDEPSLIGSITKTFTTSLIMQLIEAKKVELDQKVGSLGIGFGHPEITIKQLLQHTSGLSKYKPWQNNVPDGTSPEQIAQYVGSRPLRFLPGSRVEYSTSGFVVLGLFLEKITGQTFEQLLHNNLTSPRGYEISTFRGRYGSAGFATGGISMKMNDLAAWTKEYFYLRTTTSSPWDWSINQTTGIGVHGYCPCTHRSFMALGHMGGRTFASVDGDGVVVVIDSAGVLVLENFKKTQQLAHELRLIAGGGKTPMQR